MFIILIKRLCLSIDLIVMLFGKTASFLMPLIAVIVAFEVFSRYFLGAPTIWAYDLSLFMFGYMAALGGAYAQQQKSHINVDILYIQVSQKTKCIFNICSFSLGIIFLLVMLDTGYEKYLEAIEFDYRRQSEWAPPMYHFWLMVMLACGLFIAQFIRDILLNLYELITGNILIELKEAETDGY
ncbi:C4-dicarboxylate ABC transporter permease [Marinomonas sp. S3726]|uniref:TRAP transporter small permease subunit n=1 Tax=Marinomonas sp. S3726 TaxID=579484 RepID=UPI0005F9F46F|nr:TRAP transporter small permease [Marinomonas sp. S3726]KJZ14183.1 C4-dicarboxylate ABC transporter permease [Marinomonas sp. S3726]